MSATVRLTEERLTYLKQQIARAVPEQALTRGWRYFREKRVLSAEVVEGHSVFGAVDGSKLYAVVLDTDNFAYSTCTCPVEGGCKHMAAVYYHYTWLIGEEVEDMRERSSGAPASAAQASDAPTQADGPDAWMAWFAADSGETWKLCRHSLHPLQPVLSRLKGTARSWPRGLQRLHWMHVLAFVLRQVELAYASTDSYNRYYYEMTFTRSVDPWVASFQELAAEIEPAELTDAEREWTASLASVLLFSALDRACVLLRWDYMHHLLWERLAVHADWRQAGRAELVRLAGEGEGTVRERTVLLGSLAQLEVREGRDREAIALLTDTEFDRVAASVYGYAQRRMDQERYADVGLWIEFLYGQLSGSRNSHILRPLLQLCRRADTAVPEQSRWTDLMVSLLPHSYSELAAHWLERGKYEAWCDLQLLMGVGPDELDPADVRAVAKAAPGELVPLYHLAIDESVNTRNRQGYRNAVKLIKKLEKLYKAVGKSATWERYIEEFARKYHRLRALQEELWRAKIVQ